MRTHYQTLKVAEDAPPEVIKAAYRALSQQHHPDSNPADQQAEAVRAMQAINAAYEVLIEPEGRGAYDQSLQVERAAAKAAPEKSSALAAVEPGAGDAETGASLVPDSRGVPAAPRGVDVPGSESPRRRRRRSSRSSSSRYDGGELVPRSSEALYSSGAGSQLGRPMYSSSSASVIQGRRVALSSEEAGSEDTGIRGDNARPAGAKTFRMVIYILLLLGLGMMFLLGVVAWRVGLFDRFHAWYLRSQAAKEGLPYGSPNDVLPGASLMDEKPYTRPTLTPQGRPWPTNSSYLPGTPVLWNDGACEITVDNTLHDSDVHVKLVATASADGGGGANTTVREAYLQRGTRMRFETLRPGTYELRYRALLTGIIVRAATVELTQAAVGNASAVTIGSAAGSAVMISLYKVAPGNPQRPVLEEEAF